MPDSISSFLSERAKHCCEYCISQMQYCPDPFCRDHIFAESLGGTNDLLNLAWACFGCNNRKYNHVSAIDPLSGIRVPLYNPRKDIWQEHFSWSEDFTLIVGLSPIGRATVERLKLNRSGVVNLRRLLIEKGEHPPFHTL